MDVVVEPVSGWTQPEDMKANGHTPDLIIHSNDPNECDTNTPPHLKEAAISIAAWY
jgi:hypothetical protein